MPRIKTREFEAHGHQCRIRWVRCQAKYWGFASGKCVLDDAESFAECKRELENWCKRYNPDRTPRDKRPPARLGFPGES